MGFCIVEEGVSCLRGHRVHTTHVVRVISVRPVVVLIQYCCVNTLRLRD